MSISTGTQIQSPAPKLPWYEAHRNLVTSVVQNLVEQILGGSGGSKPRVRKKTSRGRAAASPSDFELELLDPSVLPMAEQARSELSSAMESFAVSYFNQVDKKPDPDPRTNAVTLVLPATAPLVTCVKVCLTHIPPSFECIAGRVLDWHDARLRLSKWMWKLVKNEITRTLGHRLYGDTISESTIIFGINPEKNAADHIELNCQRLGTILGMIFQSSAQSIMTTFSQHYTATDLVDLKQARTLLDAHFIKHLAPSIIALVGKACVDVTHAELARKQGGFDEEFDSDASSNAPSPPLDEKFPPTGVLGRPSRRRRGLPAPSLALPELSEFLVSLPATSRSRLNQTLVADAVIPSLVPDFKVPNLLRWKIGDRLVPRPAPFAPRDVGEDVRSSDVDWQIIKSVLVYLRQRGVDMIGSSGVSRFWQLGPLHVEGDVWDSTRAANPDGLSVRRITRKRRADGTLSLSKSDAADELPPVWGINDLRDFVEGRAAWDDPGLDPDETLAEDLLGDQLEKVGRKRRRAEGGSWPEVDVVSELWPENALAPLVDEP